MQRAQGIGGSKLRTGNIDELSSLAEFAFPSSPSKAGRNSASSNVRRATTPRATPSPARRKAGRRVVALLLAELAQTTALAGAGLAALTLFATGPATAQTNCNSLGPTSGGNGGHGSLIVGGYIAGGCGEGEGIDGGNGQTPTSYAEGGGGGGGGGADGGKGGTGGDGGGDPPHEAVPLDKMEAKAAAVGKAAAVAAAAAMAAIMAISRPAPITSARIRAAPPAAEGGMAVEQSPRDPPSPPAAAVAAGPAATAFPASITARSPRA